MKQHHYIIYYEEDTKSWVHDIDSEDVKFPEGTVFNIENQDWEYGYDKNLDPIGKHKDANEMLREGLVWLNRIAAVRHLQKDK
jgi:hypothetical protein